MLLFLWDGAAHVWYIDAPLVLSVLQVLFSLRDQ